MSKINNEIVNEKRAEGYSLQEISDCLCDGDYLEDWGITQEQAEDAHHEIQEHRHEFIVDGSKNGYPVYICQDCGEMK